MPGRKPKPTALKVLEGNPGKRRLPTDIPTDGELPEAPIELDDLARAEWERIVPGLHAMGVLASIDRAALAAYCAAFGRWQRAESALKAMAERDPISGGLMIKTSSGTWIQNPIVGTANAAAKAVIRYAAEFGMTPSARARLGMENKRQGDSKFAGLIGGRHNSAS